jgi:uncharacterized protein (TIGR03086 family)
MVMETTAPLDLRPATAELSRVVMGIGEDQLTLPTPCPAYSVADLADHVGGLAIAFTNAARKAYPPGTSPRPSAAAAELEPGWRDRIAADLAGLAEAWRDPAAYTGETEAGGVPLSGPEAAVVALNEVVVHGWDLARATGQKYAVDEATLDACLSFAEAFSGPGSEEMRGDAFGPVVPVPSGAPSLDRLIGMMGRDPGWP